MSPSLVLLTIRAFLLLSWVTLLKSPSRAMEHCHAISLLLKVTLKEEEFTSPALGTPRVLALAVMVD